jgi:hypothetical protein
MTGKEGANRVNDGQAARVNQGGGGEHNRILFIIVLLPLSNITTYSACAICRYFTSICQSPCVCFLVYACMHICTHVKINTHTYVHLMYDNASNS